MVFFRSNVRSSSLVASSWPAFQLEMMTTWSSRSTGTGPWRQLRSCGASATKPVGFPKDQETMGNPVFFFFFVKPFFLTKKPGGFSFVYLSSYFFVNGFYVFLSFMVMRK